MVLPVCGKAVRQDALDIIQGLPHSDGRRPVNIDIRVWVVANGSVVDNNRCTYGNARNGSRAVDLLTEDWVTEWWRIYERG